MEVLSVTTAVLEYLRDRIISGELKAGQRLSEAELATSLEVSRGPIREAFRVLEKEQLVVSFPRRGTFVSEVSVEDFLDLYQAREMLECYAIELLKESEKRELSEVEGALDKTVDLPFPPPGDTEAKLKYLRAFSNFHFKLVEAAGNKRVTKFYRDISNHLLRYQFMYAYIPGLTKNSQKDHTQILNLIKAGEYDKAKEFLRVHIRSFVKLMKSWMFGPRENQG